MAYLKKGGRGNRLVRFPNIHPCHGQPT